MAPLSLDSPDILMPESLLDLAAQFSPPIDLLKVAHAAGLRVAFDARLPASVRGNLLRDCGVIVVNPCRTSPQRLRMTVAHEIAEAVLYRSGRPLCFLDPPYFCPTSRAHGRQSCPHHERLCNWYGARLIVPSSWLRRDRMSAAVCSHMQEERRAFQGAAACAGRAGRPPMGPRPVDAHTLARRCFCSLTLARLRLIEGPQDFAGRFGLPFVGSRSAREKRLCTGFCPRCGRAPQEKRSTGDDGAAWFAESQPPADYPSAAPTAQASAKRLSPFDCAQGRPFIRAGCCSQSALGVA